MSQKPKQFVIAVLRLLLALALVMVTIGDGATFAQGVFTVGPAAPDSTPLAPPAILGEDSTPDLIVSPEGGVFPSRVLNGATGAELGAGMPFGPVAGGARFAGGDIDNDGVPDLVAGMGPGGGLVSVFNGDSIALLGSGYPFGPGFVGGVFLAVGDFDGDGRNDITVTQGADGGLVRVFSGTDYHLILSLAPFGPGYTGGVTVAMADLTGDGRADIIVGQRRGALVSVIDSALQAVSVSGPPFGGGFTGGVSVAAGDVNGDGRADLILAPDSAGGAVVIYDLQTVSQIGSFLPYGPDYKFGIRLAAVDITGDGLADIVTAPAPGGGADVKVFSGSAFQEVLAVPAYTAPYSSGVFVAAASGPKAKFTSATSATFTVGTAGTFTVRTQGSRVTSITVTGNLPAGLTFTNNGDGTATLAGTPTGPGGTFPLTFSANAGPGASVTQAFTLTVREAPAITSGASAPFSEGTAGTFTITSRGFPTPTLSIAGGLPSGVTFAPQSNGTAILRGTPAAGSSGTYPLTVTASNGVGANATQSLTLTVAAAPRFTSPSTATFLAGSAGTFQVTTAGIPTAGTITFTGSLPSGVTFTNNGNGTATIAGTPAATGGGLYPLTISASNGIGTGVQNLQLTVNQAPAITTANAVTFNPSVAGSFTVRTTGFPVAQIQSVGALPTGVTFVNIGDGTATLSGTPAVGTTGTYPLNLSASNGIGSPASQPFTLTVAACGVSLTPASGALPGGVYLTAYSRTFTASGGGTYTFTTPGPLPSGMSLSTGGVLSGTPTTTGAFSFTITATPASGCPATGTYTLTVLPDAQNETFLNGVGNTQYGVGTAVPPTPAVVVAGSVLTNDKGPGSLSAGPASIASTNGGQVAMNANGSFLYTPPVGFAGPSDTFSYVLTDGNGRSNTATVTINLNGVVWYVNAGAGAGDGRSQAPFNTASAASTGALAGQIIYVHPGSPAGVATLKANQQLWGAGAAFVLNGLTIGASTPPTLAGVTLASGTQLNGLAVNGGASAAISGGAGVTGPVALNNVSIVGGTSGLTLTNVTGQVTVTGGTFSGVSGGEVAISGGLGTVTIGAGINNTSGRSVDVQGRTGGTITFAGSIADTGSGILLNANTGATVAFTGGLALNTGSTDAFTVTAGGTVTAVGGANTIVTTTGTALRVQNTKIGTAGLTFRSITAGVQFVPSSGAGIILENTGTSAADGGLTITGSGAAGSGGQIQYKSGANGSITSGVGILLNNTRNAVLNWMQLNDFGNSAIVGRDVAGLTINNTVIDGAVGDTAGQNEGPVMLGLPNPGGVNGVNGSAVIHNVRISGGVEHNMQLYAHSGSVSLLMDGDSEPMCQIKENSNASGGHGLLVAVDGAATGSVNVHLCRFTDNRLGQLVATAAGTSSLTAVVNRVDFTNTFQGVQGAVFSNSGDAHLNATVVDGAFTNIPGGGAVVQQSSLNATAQSLLEASFVDNVFEYQHPSASDASMLGLFSSTPGQVSHARVLLSGNYVATDAKTEGIRIATPDITATPAIDLTMINNHVDMSDLAAPLGMNIGATQGGATTSLCANILDSLSHHMPGDHSNAALRVEQANGTTFRLERGSAALTDPPATVLDVNGRGDTTIQVLGTLSIVENGTCQLPAPSSLLDGSQLTGRPSQARQLAGGW